jgi:hypothetical protein
MLVSIGRQHACDLGQVHQGLSFIAQVDLDPAHASRRTIDHALVDLD